MIRCIFFLLAIFIATKTTIATQTQTCQGERPNNIFTNIGIEQWDICGSATILSIEADGQGNIYTLGTFDSEVDFNPDPSLNTVLNTENNTSFLLKQNYEGVLVWALELPTSATDIAVNPGTEDVYIVGNFNQPTDFFGTELTPTPNPNFPSGYYLNGFVMSLDSDGDMNWVESEGLNDGDLAFKAISYHDGKLGIAAHRTLMGPDNQVFFQLVLGMAPSSLGGISINELLDGGSPLYGFATDIVQYSGGFGMTATQDMGGIIVNLGITGSLLWKKYINNQPNSYTPTSIDMDAGGSFYITANSGSSNNLPQLGMVQSYNSNGTIRWTRSEGIVTANALVVDDWGNLYFTGLNSENFGYLEKIETNNSTSNTKNRSLSFSTRLVDPGVTIAYDRVTKFDNSDDGAGIYVGINRDPSSTTNIAIYRRSILEVSYPSLATNTLSIEQPDDEVLTITNEDSSLIMENFCVCLVRAINIYDSWSDFSTDTLNIFLAGESSVGILANYRPILDISLVSFRGTLTLDGDDSQTVEHLIDFPHEYPEIQIERSNASTPLNLNFTGMTALKFSSLSSLSSSSLGGVNLSFDPDGINSRLSGTTAEKTDGIVPISLFSLASYQLDLKGGILPEFTSITSISTAQGGGTVSLNDNAFDTSQIIEIDIIMGTGDDRFILNSDSIGPFQAGNFFVHFKENNYINNPFTDGDLLEINADADFSLNFSRLVTSEGELYFQGLERADYTGGPSNNTFMGFGFDKYLTLDGQGGSDSLHGGSSKNKLFGGDGDDYLYGRSDEDRLYGQNGNDILTGMSGNDILSGGNGHDRYRYLGTDSNNTIQVSHNGSGQGHWDFKISGPTGVDLIYEPVVQSGQINILGRGGDDTIQVFSNVTLSGFIYGESGTDTCSSASPGWVINSCEN